MAEKIIDHGSTIGKAAEQRMRHWALGMHVQDQMKQKPTAKEFPSQIHPYLAISRQVGAGGSAVAASVGQKLGWEVLDRTLLNYMARHYELPGDMLAHVDETTSNWMVEVFGKWLDHHLVTQAEFVVHLGRIVLMAARHASAVFVGRGAQFILPRRRGLAVRIIAPRQQRIERIMHVHELPRGKAEKYVDQHEQGRSDFVKKYFHQNVGDPHLYDLVLNLEYFDVDCAVALIVDQLQRCFGVGIAP